MEWRLQKKTNKIKFSSLLSDATKIKPTKQGSNKPVIKV